MRSELVYPPVHVSLNLKNKKNLLQRVQSISFHCSVHGRATVQRSKVQQSATIYQRHQQFLRAFGARRHRQRRLARLLAVEIRIEAVVAHLLYFLDMARADVVYKAPQIRLGVHGAQLALIKIRYFVDAPFVL